MAQPLTPQPNTPLVPGDPRADFMWRQWLGQVLTRVYTSSQISHGSLADLQGGTTGEYYHLTAAQSAAVSSLGSFGPNRVVYTNSVSSLATQAGFEFSAATSTATLPNVSTTGNLTVGGSSSDVFTINAGTWTYAANLVATRALGEAPAGITNILGTVVTFSANPAGTTNARAAALTVTASGSDNFNSIFAQRVALNYTATGAATTLSTDDVVVSHQGTNTVASAIGRQVTLSTNGSGNINSGNCFFAAAPSNTSTGAIVTLNGFRVGNLGNATVTTAIGIKVDNFTNSVTMRGIQSSLTSGAGKFNLFIDGTADNMLAGLLSVSSLSVTSHAITGGFAAAIRQVTTAAYSTVQSDFTVLGNASSLAITIHLPNASTFPGKLYNLKKIDSSGNAVTISSVSLIDGVNTTTLPAQYDKIRVQSTSTQWFVI